MSRTTQLNRTSDPVAQNIEIPHSCKCMTVRFHDSLECSDVIAAFACPIVKLWSSCHAVSSSGKYNQLGDKSFVISGIFESFVTLRISRVIECVLPSDRMPMTSL